MSKNAVTYHAVVRHFKRVHRMETTERYPHASNWYRAEIICGRLGLTLNEARDEVLPPRPRPSLALGDGRIRFGDRTLAIKSGRVATCLPPAVHPKKLRQRAERERADA